MDIKKRILLFLSSEAFGVVGASNNRDKYGNKVLRCYLQHGLTAIPVNPREKTIERLPSVASVTELPSAAASISIITPPAITEKVVEEAITHGIGSIWMQPGAEIERAVAKATAAGINLIADGSCLLVVLGFADDG